MVIFLILRPRLEERANHNKPEGGKEKSYGFEGRSM